MKYASKTIYKTVIDESDARIVRNIAAGERSNIVNAVWSSEELKGCLLDKVEQKIQEECTSLCSRKSPSTLADVTPASIISLKDSDIENELKERAPTLYRCLQAAASSKRNQAKVKVNCRKDQGEVMKTTRAISMASSVLLRCHNPSLSAMAYLLSILLWHAGAEKQVHNVNFGICNTHTILVISLTACMVHFPLLFPSPYSWVVWGVIQGKYMYDGAHGESNLAVALSTKLFL